MKDIKHNQAGGYEDKSIVRKIVGAGHARDESATTPQSSIVPTLRRTLWGINGNAVSDAPASRNAGALQTAFPRRSVGTINMRSRALLAISLAALSGCSAWSSNPVRTQANYGASVRNMVSNQIYNPDKAQNPDALLPDGIEGAKAATILQGRAYRGDIGNPADVGHSLLGNPGLSARGGSTR